MKIKLLKTVKTICIYAGIPGIGIFGSKFFTILLTRNKIDYYYMTFGSIFALLFIIGLVLKFNLKKNNID
ncbi:hypothetical protein J6TS7_35950 [Paenibacillus dendritiformis]|nr:hypothetical protein J6TS7_35950 [Paenibacillus dendritiformis]